MYCVNSNTSENKNNISTACITKDQESGELECNQIVRVCTDIMFGNVSLPFRLVNAENKVNSKKTKIVITNVFGFVYFGDDNSIKNIQNEIVTQTGKELKDVVEKLEKQIKSIEDFYQIIRYYDVTIPSKVVWHVFHPGENNSDSVYYDIFITPCFQKCEHFIHTLANQTSVKVCPDMKLFPIDLFSKIIPVLTEMIHNCLQVNPQKIIPKPHFTLYTIAERLILF